jgi:hypothetical protein
MYIRAFAVVALMVPAGIHLFLVSGCGKTDTRRHSCTPWMAWNPNYKFLRADPRCHHLVQRLNLPDSRLNPD